MTKIDFNEPSIGTINQANKFALKVNINGNGSQGILGQALGAGDATGGAGVFGVTERIGGHAVIGESRNEKAAGAGVLGTCFGQWAGVQGVCIKPNGMGVFAECRVDGGTGILARGNPQGKGKAGRFEGDVEVTGDIRLLNADCAEDFDVVESESKDSV